MTGRFPVLLLVVLVFGPAAFTQEIVPAGKTVPPRVIKEVKPVYTPEAKRNQISGTVQLECVVRTDGTPANIRVTRGLDPGLDAQAIKALEQWRFRPAEKDSRPVPFTVGIEMAFTLRDKAPSADAAPQASQNVFKPGNGVSAPVLVKDVKPQYPPSAMQARVQGRVAMNCVVLPDGSVGDVRISQPLDPDIDRTAIETVKLWTFKPGLKDGQPVPVEITVEMSFSLK